MNKSKAAVVTSQIRQIIEMILGCGIATFFVLGLLCSIGDEDFLSTCAFCAFFLAIAAFLIFKSIQKKKLISNFKAYVQILAGDPYNSLDTIAAKTGTSVDVVKKNLKQMIEKHFFVNAAIDENSNSLILNGKADTQQILSWKANGNVGPAAQGTAGSAQPAALKTEMLSIKCKGCGAVNVVPRGEVIECEYCGNMIKGE